MFSRNDQSVCLHLWWKSWVSKTRVTQNKYSTGMCNVYGHYVKCTYECIIYCVMSSWSHLRRIYLCCVVRGWGVDDLNSMNEYYIMNREPCEMKCHVNVHCVQLHALLYMWTMYDPQFDGVRGHVRDPSSNSILLLTSTIIVQSFIILRRLVYELSWDHTDGHSRRSHKVFWGTLNKQTRTWVFSPRFYVSHLTAHSQSVLYV